MIIGIKIKIFKKGRYTMPINEQQIQKLSEKIEDILQSTNFGDCLLYTSDAADE